MIPLTPLGGACRRRHLVAPTADKRHIWRMRPCGLISGHAWEVCFVVWVRVELYTLPGHSSRCNRKETETHAQGAASATTRKKQKQRQKWINTSSTAQGGGGSFKNRKPIGKIGCCESGMAERIHWWTERCLRSPLFLSLSLTIYLPTYLSSMYLSIYRSIYLSLSFI